MNTLAEVIPNLKFEGVLEQLRQCAIRVRANRIKNDAIVAQLDRDYKNNPALTEKDWNAIR